MFADEGKKRRHKHAIIRVLSRQTLLVQATAEYIPFANFVDIFTDAGDLVKKHDIRKVIFDKRKLTVFNQPSMVWYFVEWKEQMYYHGLMTHIKILPSDQSFRQSAKIGREKIFTDFPHGRFHQLVILYAETLEEALIL